MMTWRSQHQAEPGDGGQCDVEGIHGVIGVARAVHDDVVREILMERSLEHAQIGLLGSVSFPGIQREQVDDGVTQPRPDCNAVGRRHDRQGAEALLFYRVK